MRSSLDSEVPLETLPNKLDAEAHGYRDFLKQGSRSLIDRYIENELGIEVNLRSRNVVGDLKVRDLAFVFENDSSTKVAVFEGHPWREDDSQIAFRGRGADDMQSPVSVDSCPVIQDSQTLTDIPLPSLRREISGSTCIRLYGFDKTTHVIGNPLHAFHGLFKFVGVGTDSEVPLLLIGGRVLAKLQAGGIVDTRVQSGSELVQHFSKLEREWQYPIGLSGDKELPCPIVLYLGERSVNVVCIKTVPDFCECLSMRFCPRNSIPARIEW